MHRTAVSIAVAAFFALAGVGMASGVPPFVCGLRALAGAGVAYALTIVAGRVLVHVLAGLLARRPPPMPPAEEPDR